MKLKYARPVFIYPLGDLHSKICFAFFVRTSLHASQIDFVFVNMTLHGSSYKLNVKVNRKSRGNDSCYPLLDDFFSSHKHPLQSLHPI